MSKFLVLAAIIAVPLVTFHLCSGPFHMKVEERLPHIIIALMAVAIQKLVEVESAAYQRFLLRLRRRIRVFVGRRLQRLVGMVARLARLLRRK